MAIELNPKKVVLSQIKEDLESGLTRWKKDDIGFGSLEKKYNLTMPEMIELFAHPKVRNIETKIPTFIIVDDLEDTQPVVEQSDISAEIPKPVENKATIQVAVPQKTAKIIVEQPKEKLEAFM